MALVPRQGTGEVEMRSCVRILRMSVSRGLTRNAPTLTLTLTSALRTVYKRVT